MKNNSKDLGLVTKKFNNFYLVDLKNKENEGKYFISSLDVGDVWISKDEIREPKGYNFSNFKKQNILRIILINLCNILRDLYPYNILLAIV